MIETEESITQSESRNGPLLVADVWEQDSSETVDGLIIDIDGFEGPLDLLLSLAREQKVDLTKISILALVQQYLDYIAEAKYLRLEVAADYLVMAAWLAYLKSRLLLPPENDEQDEPSGEEMAAILAHRLRRLEAMREAAARLMTRNLLGRDLFSRGAPEGVRVIRTPQYEADVFDLLISYAHQRERTLVARVEMKPRKVWSIKQARIRLEQMLGISLEWTPILNILSKQFTGNPTDKQDIRSLKASTFGASLEMARDGKLELKQAEAFTPIYARQRAD